MSNKTTTRLAQRGLHALVWQEDDLFVARCVEVEVASQGSGEAEAVHNLDEALDLFFEDSPSKVPKLSNLQFIVI